MYKPDSYNSLSPYLIVDDARSLAELIKKIFDAEELRRFEREDGLIQHLELKIDDSVLMMSNSVPGYPAQKTMLHVYVPDVMKTFDKAIASGCQLMEEPKNRPGDPDKRGAFLDCAGNYWAVSTQME